MKCKVAIYCHNLYAGDILWGFTAAGYESLLIKPTSIDHFDKLMQEMNPDVLLLSSCMDFFQHPMLNHIGARNAPHYQCVYWDTEGIGQFNLQMTGIQLLKPDMVFSICPAMLDVLKSKSIPCKKLDFAYNPTIHFPKAMSDDGNFTISLVGNAWAWYANAHPTHFRYSIALPVLIKPLLENDCKIDFYGTKEYKPVIKKFLNLDVPNEWFKGTVSYAATCDIYNNSFVNLITQNHYLTITRRTFEILGSGGFGLSCDNIAVKNMFGNSGGLAISNSAKETLDLVEYYRNHMDAYKSVRKNAVVSVQQHTYKERAEEIVNTMFQKQGVD